jgi:type IV pilus assembly protein PilX
MKERRSMKHTVVRSVPAQRGAALMMALIFLVVMTVIGTTAMRISALQEQMAGNARDWNLAFQAAEAALREAETFIQETPVLPEFNDEDGFYQLNSADRPVWAGTVPSDGNGFITYAGALDGTSAPPQYYIEEMSSVRPAGTETETGTPMEESSYYRITAVGYGGAVNDDGTAVSSVVLSTVYRNR